MRLVGPNCFGVAVPGIGLDATFAVHRPSAGKAGLVVQSGGLGAALVEHFSRLGIGTSSFVSVGDMLDVCGTDMLMWWEADHTTELAVLYLESFGDPRRFARTARRVSATIPILTVHAGRSAPGQRAAASHTAAAAAPLITRQALFDQAGIIATTSFSELLDAAVLIASQPVPAGRRVAIVSSGGGAGVLAADACAEAGLAIATPGLQARRLLRDVLPDGSALGGPVDTTATVSVAEFGTALHIAAGEEGVDAVIALVVRNSSADLTPALTAAAAAGPDRGGRAGPARVSPAAARRRRRPGRARLRVPGSGRPGAGPGRPLRVLAIPARWHGPGHPRPAGGGRTLDRRVFPGPDAGRRLAVRGRGRRPAGLLRPPDGRVPPGGERRCRGRRGSWLRRPRGDQG